MFIGGFHLIFVSNMPYQNFHGLIVNLAEVQHYTFTAPVYVCNVICIWHMTKVA